MGCEAEVPMEDEEAPAITIVCPIKGQAFASQDSVEVHIQISENTELHNVSFWVWTADSGAYVSNFAIHSHDKSMDVKQKFFYPVTEATSLLLEVEASDHNGNVALDSLYFQLNP